jgi:cytochrome c-type biogenesis protein
MLDSVFTGLYDAMTGSVWLAILAAYAWGVLSVLLSPCHLSSIPLIVGYISAQGKMNIKKTFYISLVFSLGILITIAAIGAITFSLGRLMGDIGAIGNYIVAGVFFVVGLYLLDVIKLNWNGFRMKQVKSSSLITVLILGLIFGLALGPCTFAYMAPVLGIVFETAKTNYIISIVFLASFAVGHCSVIVGAGTLAGKVQSYLDWTEKSKVTLWIKRICGVLVMAGGVYFIFM